jgi:catechol 1,2-dioxygenase
MAANALSFDLSVTDSVINATGPNASPRIRDVIANLTRHLHDFCRESRVTRSEFEAALKIVGNWLS